MTSAQKRVLENTAALFCLQASTYLFPLITLPYLARTLGRHNFGVYSFAFAITQYLIVLTDFGFNLSATRAIAREREDDERITSIVSVVYTIKILLLVVAFGVLICAVKYVPQFHDNGPVLLACFLSVVGGVLFPLWYFQGLECMTNITILQVSGRLVGTLLIFKFVSNSSDCALAAALQSSGTLIGGVGALLLVKRNRHLQVTLPGREAVKAGLSEGWSVFTTSAMSTTLQNGAVLALGFSADMAVVGAYAAVERLAKAIVFLFSPLTQAFFPYASKKFSQSHEAGVLAVTVYGRYVVAVACTVALFVAIASRMIVSLVFGQIYAEYHIVLRVLAIWMVLGVVNNFAGVQLLVASGRASTYSKCFGVSAATTMALLVLLVPAFGYRGAMSGMTLGEAVLTLAMLWAIRRCAFLSPRPAQITIT